MKRMGADGMMQEAAFAGIMEVGELCSQRERGNDDWTE